MLRLRPYKPCDAEKIVTWCKDERDFRRWSADRFGDYPLTPEAMNTYIDNDRYNDTNWAFTAFDETGAVGYITMRFPDESRKVIRLGFVLVDNSKRGMGYGKELVSQAVKFAFDFVKVDKVSLGVFEGNDAAIGCYSSCGFQEVTLPEVEKYLCLGEVWNCIEMEIKR